MVLPPTSRSSTIKKNRISQNATESGLNTPDRAEKSIVDNLRFRQRPRFLVESCSHTSKKDMHPFCFVPCSERAVTTLRSAVLTFWSGVFALWRSDFAFWNGVCFLEHCPRLLERCPCPLEQCPRLLERCLYFLEPCHRPLERSPCSPDQNPRFLDRCPCSLVRCLLSGAVPLLPAMYDINCRHA